MKKGLLLTSTIISFAIFADDTVPTLIKDDGSSPIVDIKAPTVEINAPKVETPVIEMPIIKMPSAVVEIETTQIVVPATDVIEIEGEIPPPPVLQTEKQTLSWFDKWILWKSEEDIQPLSPEFVEGEIANEEIIETPQEPIEKGPGFWQKTNTNMMTLSNEMHRLAYPSRMTIKTLTILKNYRSPRILADIIQRRTAQPYILLPANEKEEILFVPGRGMPFMGITQRQLAKFVKFINPKKIMILGGDSYVPSKYKEMFKENAFTVVFDSKQWWKNAEKAELFLNMKELKREFLYLSQYDLENNIYSATPAKIIK